jgi:hypothetical protein
MKTINLTPLHRGLTVSVPWDYPDASLAPFVGSQGNMMSDKPQLVRVLYIGSRRIVRWLYLPGYDENHFSVHRLRGSSVVESYEMDIS